MVDRRTINRWRALAVLNGILTYCTARLFELIRGDYKPFIALEESAQERDLLAFEPPAKGTALIKLLQAIFWPQRAITPPELFGAESLGDQTPDGRAVGGGSGPFGFAPTRWEQRRATRVWLNDWVCRACSANLLDGWEGSS
eukprot:g27471.t1